MIPNKIYVSVRRRASMLNYHCLRPGRRLLPTPAGLFTHLKVHKSKSESNQSDQGPDKSKSRRQTIRIKDEAGICNKEDEMLGVQDE